MSRGVARGLLDHGGLEGGGQVDAGLVGQADEDEEDVGELFAQLAPFVGRLEALVAVEPRHEPGYLADLLDQDGQVGQLRVVAHADGLDPVVYLLLALL